MAGDEQAVLNPGGQRLRPLPPSDSLVELWRRYCAARLLVCILCVCTVCVLVYFCVPLPSGMGPRLTTPLSLTLEHWKDVKGRASNLSVEIRRKKWQTLCGSEWPAFNVGWPQEGSFNIDCILQIKERVFDTGLHGHPNEVPYIITWESLAQDPPSWVAPFVAEKPKIPSADTPTAPPAQSPLYPILKKEKLTAKTKPVIPPG